MKTGPCLAIMLPKRMDIKMLEWNVIAFGLVCVVIGAVLANVYRRVFPWLYSVPLFYVWYSNNIMVRPKLAKTRLAKKIHAELQKRLAKRVKIEYTNIFDIWNALYSNDNTHTKLFFREVDSIMDRHIADLCSSQYTVARVNEVYRQFEEHQKSQESQSV